jgi:uncharacterized membrane protein
MAAFVDTLATSAADRRLAALLHLSCIPAPIVAPVVGICLFRRNRFVTAHALQCLYETLVLNILLGIAILASFAYTLSRLWHHYQTGWQDFSLVEFGLRFLVGWLALGILAGINTLLAIRAALRANGGAWPRHGHVVKALHRRFP